MLLKKCLRRAEALREQAPQAAPAHFRALACESFDRSLGMFVRGFSDRFMDAHPIAHGRHFPEGHARLHHAVRAGIHAEKDHPFFSACEALDVALVRFPRVFQRLIDAVNGCAEFQIRQIPGQLLRGCDESLHKTIKDAQSRRLRARRGRPADTTR
jgi:hypothetical protein